MLTPERWERLQALFSLAVDLPPAEREAFVGRETAGDEELARELNGMLDQHGRAGERIARAIDLAAAAESSGAAWIGRHFGPYRLVREIGHGGMGFVFEAVRDDLEYQKTVALKVAPWYRDTPELRERFRLERQILASLEHPNIARLLDGGSSEGVPYFVMEYVQGQPITAYGDARQLDLARRIQLFAKVCEAVYAAHENLIVHRDLKPTNILVDESGAPKLLDFGIAKLITPATDSSMTQVAGHAPWTPDYASPEQVRGRPVTVRTDVYSLGLVLYELLTGERAQQADISSPAALEQSICEREPRPASVAVLATGDRARARRLRGDLDTIVAMALAKEPERRYASVAAFRDDLERFLAGRPVRARPATGGYRARKFIARNRVGVAAAALVVAIAGAGVVSTLYQARRAERRFDQVRKLANAFVFDVHDRIEMVPGSTEARKAIVQTALSYLENLRAEASGDPGLAREIAAAYEKVGTVQGNPLRTNLGDSAGALASYQRATDLLSPLADRGDPVARRQLMSVLDHVGVLHRAQGDLPKASASWARAREVGERQLRETPHDPAVLTSLGNLYSNISRASVESRGFPMALETAQRAMEVADQLLALDPRNPDHQNNLATAFNVLGGTQLIAGELAASAQSYRKSIDIREALIGAFPENTDYRRNLLIGNGSLGDVLGYRPGANLGDTTGAIAAYDRAIALGEWARQRDPADRRATFDLAQAKLRLGAMLSDDSRDLPRARAELEAAERLNLSLLKEDPTSERFGYVSMVIDRRLGNVLAAQGHISEAAIRLERSRTNATKYLNGAQPVSARQALVYSTLNLALLQVPAHPDKAAELGEVVSIELTKGPIDTPAVDAIIYRDLGRLFEQLAASAAASQRDQWRRRAVANWQTSLERWRDPTLAKEMRTHRDEQVRLTQSDIRRVEGSLKH